MKRAIALCLAVLVLLCGCGREEQKETVSYPIDSSRALMGDTLESYTAAINGMVLEFPLSYSKFATTGFEVGSNLKNVTLKAGQYSIYKVSSGENNCEVYIANLTEKTQKITSCTVCGVVANKDSSVALLLPKEVTFGQSEGEILEKYGPAAKTESSEVFEDILIYGSELTGAKLNFKDGKLFEVYYYRIINPEELQFSSQAPEEVKAYKDPEALSSNLSDFTFYLYGTTYTMPLPVSRLIEGGWIKVAEKEDYIPANSVVEEAVKLTAANRTLTLGVKNVADYPTSVENCYVTSIASTNDVKLDLTLANGCRVGTTAYNLENTFGKDNFTEVKEKGDNTYYIYNYKGEAKLTVISNNNTGYITEIKIELL